MAIGNYWEAVLPHGTHAPPLQRIIEETAPLVREDFPSWRLEPDGKNFGPAEFACLGSPQGDLRSIAHLIKTPGRTNFYLHSAFPWLAVGAPARLTVYGISADSFALEGFIHAGINGRSLTFFDPLFALNKARYAVGGEYEFMLAAFSLNVRRASGRELDVTMTAVPEAFDYYRFRGYVHMVRGATFLDQSFEVFRTAVSRAGAGHLYVDIYVNRSRLELPGRFGCKVRWHYRIAWARRNMGNRQDPSWPTRRPAGRVSWPPIPAGGSVHRRQRGERPVPGRGSEA